MTQQHPNGGLPPVESDPLRAAALILDGIIARECYTFAECSDAEQIMDDVRKARDLIGHAHGVPPSPIPSRADALEEAAKLCEWRELRHRQEATNEQGVQREHRFGLMREAQACKDAIRAARNDGVEGLKR